MAEATSVKSGNKRGTLSSYAILLIVLVVLALLTLVMDACHVEGITAATLSQVMMAPVLGFQDAIGVCLFVMVLGGFLGVVTETGALDAGIAVLVHKLKGNELLLIPILMFAFSIGGTTYGMCEETVPFYLLLAATMVAAGFDSLTGAAMVLLGSTVDPFVVGVAVDSLASSGIEVNQAIILVLGALLWLMTTTISIVYVMRYAKKVKADKGSTFLSLQERRYMENEWGAVEAEADATETPRMTSRQKWALIVFGVAFVIMIVSFVPWEDLGFDGFVAGLQTEEVTTAVDGDDLVAAYDEANGSTTELSGSVEGTSTTEETVHPAWSSFLTGVPLGRWYFDEAITWFFLLALVIGAIGGMSESRFVKVFIGGAADMMPVVFVVALARSVTVLMSQTGLDVWILQNAANALSGMAATVFAPLSFMLYVLLSFLIPSSSGMATVSMPIMGGLANQLHLSVETMVMIYSAGNGLVNLFTPTQGAIMGGLALAHIEYTTWLKFGAKLFVIIGLACIVLLTCAMVILS